MSGDRTCAISKYPLSFGGQFPGRVLEAEICGFQPDLIPYFPQGETSGGTFSHDPTGHFMSGQGFFSGFFQGSHVVFECR